MKKQLTPERKQLLIEAVIKQISNDIFADDDFTVLEELIKQISVSILIQALPEDQWADFPEIEMKKPDHEKEARIIYEKKGASAVYDHANKHRLPYGYCKLCEAETPEHKGSCLICGSTIQNNSKK